MLRLILPEDYSELYKREVAGDLGARWRHRGRTPRFEVWVESLFAGILAQFLVVDARTGRPIGLVAAYNANSADGYCYVAGAKFSDSDTSGLLLHGLVLFVQYLFDAWTFRKLYAEVSEFNFDQFSSGERRLFKVEGRLREHTYYRERYWDQILLAIYRDDWSKLSPALSAFVTGPRRS